MTHLFQQVEIHGYRARVIGLTRGIRTFTTSPAVFTSFKNAQNYAGLRLNQTLYLRNEYLCAVRWRDRDRRLGRHAGRLETPLPNGFEYYPNCLHNLLIASSMGGRKL